MIKNRSLMIFLFLTIVSISLISAVPGWPHQFYGDVYVDGESADNNIMSI